MTPNSLTIRVAEERDVEPISMMLDEIERYYGVTEIDPLEQRVRQTAHALFGPAPYAHVLVCIDDNSGKLVGFVSYSFIWPASGATHALFMKELFITEDYRGKGLAIRLMRELQDVAMRRRGCSRIEWTADGDNPLALNFYQKHGFGVHQGKVHYRWPAADKL